MNRVVFAGGASGTTEADLVCLRSTPRSLYRLWPVVRWSVGHRPAACPPQPLRPAAARRRSNQATDNGIKISAFAKIYETFRNSRMFNEATAELWRSSGVHVWPTQTFKEPVMSFMSTDRVYEPAGLSRSPHKVHQVSLLVRPWLCWPRGGAVSSLPRSPRPDPCRPERAYEGRRQRTPVEGQRVRRISRTASDERTEASLTLRCDVVTSFSLLQDGWSLSKMMVSAPLQ